MGTKFIMGKLLEWPRQVKIRRQKKVDFIDTTKAEKDLDAIYRLLEDLIILLARAGLITKRPFASLIRSSHLIQDARGAVKKLSRVQHPGCPVLCFKKKDAS
jgi:hypothetical protein